MKIITAIAPVNIAIIKYWGKRDEELILPMNDSISTTLDIENMCAKTTVMISPEFSQDKFWLNGNEENFQNQRLLNCLKEIKSRISNENREEMCNWKIHICSENNFPTAAGLASSAAGYACLIYALSALFNIKEEISGIARRGSGSACRSLYGGWVRWFKGVNSDGSDSIATQIFKADHWPEIGILILVVNDSRKKYSSTSGMKQSVLTSELLNYRTNSVVPERIDEIINAVRERNFEIFAKLTMQDSNQFHAICTDSYPPCFYMNDVSHAIINMVHLYNESKGEIKAAYTFDAGPNACLYLKNSDLLEIVNLINYLFPTDQNSSNYYRGIPIDNVLISQDFSIPKNLIPYGLNKLKYIIRTKVGEGPKLIANPEEHLLDTRGFPKKMK